MEKPVGLPSLDRVSVQLPYLRTMNRLIYVRSILQRIVPMEIEGLGVERRKAIAALTNLEKELRKEFSRVVDPRPRGANSRR